MGGLWTTYRYSTGTGAATASILATSATREEIEERVRECLAQNGSFTLHGHHSSLIIPARQVLDVRVDPDGPGPVRHTFDPPRHIPTQR